MLHSTRIFEKLRVKRGKLICKLTFLSRCRDHHVIPTCMSLHFHTKSNVSTKILHNASMSLLRDAIHNTRHQLHIINVKLHDAHDELSTCIHPVLWQSIEEKSFQRSEDDTAMTTERHIRKFNVLKFSKALILSYKYSRPTQNFSSQSLLTRTGY